MNHVHCFDDQEDHKNHLRCCLCQEVNPKIMEDKPMYYRLDKETGVITADYKATISDQEGLVGYWGWWERDRLLWRDEGDYIVSTIFLGIDHCFTGGEPLLFETMVFDSEEKYNGDYQVRTHTMEQARAAHQDALQQYVIQKK